MKYKNYLFDWDGCLGNSLPFWFEAYKDVFAEFGVEVNFLMIGEKVVGDWDAPAKFGLDNEEFFKRMEEKLLTKLPFVQLNDGAMKLLNEIKKSGGKVAVLTTSKRKYVEQTLKNLGLFEKVDLFLGKEDVTKCKPDPEIILKTIEMLGGKKEDTVMIGDTDKDILAAKSAGVESVLYFPDRYTEFYDVQKQLYLGATRVIKDFGEKEVF